MTSRICWASKMKTEIIEVKQDIFSNFRPETSHAENFMKVFDRSFKKFKGI